MNAESVTPLERKLLSALQQAEERFTMPGRLTPGHSAAVLSLPTPRRGEPGPGCGHRLMSAR
jgi:hypothetical protein